MSTGTTPPGRTDDEELDSTWQGWQRTAVIVLCTIIAVVVLLLVIFAFDSDDGTTPTPTIATLPETAPPPSLVPST